jgi:hypothetical protein
MRKIDVRVFRSPSSKAQVEDSPADVIRRKHWRKEERLLQDLDFCTDGFRRKSENKQPSIERWSGDRAEEVDIVS